MNKKIELLAAIMVTAMVVVAVLYEGFEWTVNRIYVPPGKSLLLRYKGQEAVERRYGNLKGPLAVAPVFLKNNRRIAALITVISLALLIFCLIEREARRNLAPATKIDGLYNRQPARPTGRLILTALAGMQLIPATATSPAQITRPTTVQARLLELLSVNPARPP